MSHFVVMIVIFAGLPLFAADSNYIRPLYSVQGMREGFLLPFRVEDENKQPMPVEKISFIEGGVGCSTLVDPFQPGNFHIKCGNKQSLKISAVARHPSLGRLLISYGKFDILPFSLTPTISVPTTEVIAGTPNPEIVEGQRLHELYSCASCHSTKWGSSKQSIVNAISQIGAMKTYQQGALLKITSAELDKIALYLAKKN